MQNRPRINWYTIIGTILIVGGGLLALYPFSPLIVYTVKDALSSSDTEQESTTPVREEEFVQPDEPLPAYTTQPVSADTPESEPTKQKSSGTPKKAAPVNMLIIPKIGVKIPIVEGNEYALERGAWRLPQSAVPDKVGNTILTAHRYKYLPPSSKTFYLLNKLKTGDRFTVIWNNKEYHYRVDTRQIKPGADKTMLVDSFDRRVTLITCDPLFSTKNRLIVSGRMIKS